MTKPDQRARDIFKSAVEIAQPAERQAYLDHACGAFPDLRKEVQFLLDAHDGAGSFLEKPAARALNESYPAGDENVSRTIDYQSPKPEAAPVGHVTVDAATGTFVGRYKLVEKIAEGGMGAVYLAEQEIPHRLVALKLIRADKGGPQFVARFEAERQALALMDHPCVAKIYDAGATDSGSPFFVMEWVPGAPLARYCDDERLTVRQRLELFAPICEAIQHAHQKGIIHRDLKPSNILVASKDGEAVPSDL